MSELHFVGGEKGGVGKSVVARLLAQYFIDHEVAWQGFDADLSHGALMRYYSDFAQPVDLERLEALDSLVEIAVESPDDKLLVDLAAQSERKLHAWADGIDIDELANDLGTELVFWHVMHDGKDSVNLLDRLMSRYGDSVRYVVVKNAARGDRFEIFDQSAVRERVEQLDVPVLELRALHHPLMQKIDRLDKSFWGAVNNQDGGDTSLGIMERQRVKIWLKRAYEAFDALDLAG